MSAPAKPGNRLPPATLVLVLAVAAFGLVLMMGVQRAPALEKSAIGFDGLASWLSNNEQPARSFHGGGALSSEGVGLRILPIYDSDLNVYRSSIQTEAHLLQDIRPIMRHVVTGKIETLPTLVILPKWSDGVRLGAITHPDFLYTIAPEPAQEEVEDLTTEKAAALQMAWTGFRTPDYTLPDGDALTVEEIELPEEYGGTAQIYAPQWMATPPNCEAIIGTAQRSLLATCSADDTTYWLLSDPDLLNNHGLQHADNALFAASFIEQIAGNGSVLIDYSNRIWLVAQTTPRERTWADLRRYFEPPMTAFWIAGMVLLAAILWRSGVRALPLATPFQHGHGAARSTALRAQARLMRNARADGALLRALAHARTASLCDIWLGREARYSDRVERMMRILTKKNTQVAAEYRAATDHIHSLPDRIRIDDAVAALSQLEDAYKKALELA